MKTTNKTNVSRSATAATTNNTNAGSSSNSATASAAAPVTAPPTTTPPSPTPITGVANGSNHGTKVDLQTSYQALITGLLAFYQPTDVFPLKSGTFTRDEVIAQLQQFITAAERTKADHTTWRNSVQAERGVEVTVRPVRTGIRSIVQARFGKDGTQLLQFGFAPTKATKKSAASKAGAAVKAVATREARGTKGKVQKKNIHGTPPGAVTTVTVAVPAAPAASAPPVVAPVAAPVGALTAAPAPASPAPTPLMTAPKAGTAPQS